MRFKDGAPGESLGRFPGAPPIAVEGTLLHVADVSAARMKMLFFSADNAEVEQVSQEFAQAGIACEVRNSPSPLRKAGDVELWIRDDRDCHRAFLLCVELGIGFAKRAGEATDLEFDWW